ncbi:hypothetical protein PMAYCL1PPCAC_03163, partial [Pristionchus mayeri]
MGVKTEDGGKGEESTSDRTRKEGEKESDREADVSLHMSKCCHPHHGRDKWMTSAVTCKGGKGHVMCVSCLSIYRGQVTLFYFISMTCPFTKCPGLIDEEKLQKVTGDAGEIDFLAHLQSTHLVHWAHEQLIRTAIDPLREQDKNEDRTCLNGIP